MIIKVFPTNPYKKFVLLLRIAESMNQKTYRYADLTMMGDVEKSIYNKLSEHPLLFTVIDPADHKSIETAIDVGVKAYESGTDALLISGSTDVSETIVDEVCSGLKRQVDIPLIIFPGNVSMISKSADAIYFMSMLNSTNTYWITRSQMIGAPMVARSGIEALSVAYTVVEPGGTVGWVGEANLIPRRNPKIAAAFGMAAEYMGFHFFITDAGSNPADGHIPLPMIQIVSSVIKIPYIVAGGIRTPEEASAVVKAGADIIQVGTAFKKDSSADKMKKMVDAVHKSR